MHQVPSRLSYLPIPGVSPRGSDRNQKLDSASFRLQTITPHGQANAQSIRLPVVRDFSGQLARHRHASQNGAEPLMDGMTVDQRATTFFPHQHEKTAALGCGDFDLSVWCRERTIFCGIRGEFVQEEGEGRDGLPRDQGIHTASPDTRLVRIRPATKR